MGKNLLLRLAALVAVGGLVAATQGCAVARYFQYRFEDATEVVDVGITISKTSQLALYWNSLDLLVIGYSDFDGYFVGYGGGQIGVTRLYNHCWGSGLAFGEETIGWGWDLGAPGEAKPDDMLIRRRSGILGILSWAMHVDITGNEFGCSPNYTPACVHFVPHIGYVGVVWNARYMEFLDFALGWAGIDICGDDGYPAGKWSFPRRQDEPKAGTAPVSLLDTPPPSRSSRAASADVVIPPMPVAVKRVQPATAPVAQPPPERVTAVPTKSPPPEIAPASGPHKYVVKQGDVGLMQVAREQLRDVHKWKIIALLNHLESPYTIVIGQELLLPN